VRRGFLESFASGYNVHRLLDADLAHPAGNNPQVLRIARGWGVDGVIGIAGVAARASHRGVPFGITLEGCLALCASLVIGCPSTTPVRCEESSGTPRGYGSVARPSGELDLRCRDSLPFSPP